MGTIDDMYRPPQSPSAAAKPKPAGAGLKWIYAAAGLAWLGAALLGFAAAAFGLYLLGAVVGLSWLYFAWADIPREDRSMTEMDAISPGGAVGRLFVPIYGAYWGFSVHARLNEAITASLRKRGVQLRAEPELAYLAMGLTILGRLAAGAEVAGASVVLLALATVFWFAYMLRCDTFRRTMALAWLAEREREAGAASAG